MRTRSVARTTSVAMLVVLLAACGGDAESPTPPAQETPSAEAPPSTEAPSGEDAADLPSEPTAYVELFLDAMRSGDEDLALRLGPADGFALGDDWFDLTAGAPETTEGDPSETLVTVPFEEGGELQVWVDTTVIADQGDHGILAVIHAQ